MGLLPREQLRQLIKENDIKDVNGIYDTLKDMFKDVLQEMLEAEMDVTLGYGKNEAKDKDTTNIRNGYSSKTLKTKFGNIEMDIPRDRNSEFEPKIVPKYQRNISGIEDKIIALYARGMSTRDIHDQVKDIYGIEVSAEMVSKITEKIVPEIKEWQSRPLETVYPFVFMDAIHYKIRDNGQIVNKAAYVVLGINMDGYKDVLGIWIGENETSKFWLGVLNELKNRNVQDVLIFSVDGLTGSKRSHRSSIP
jgi:putative transposase